MDTSISPSANPVFAGTTLTLTVVVTNNTGAGNATATSVTRTVTGLPTGLSGVTFGGSGAAGATYNAGAGSVTFTGGPYSLAASNVGSTLDFTISFVAPSSQTSFTATSAVGSANRGSATSSVTVTITPVADVTTTLSGPTFVYYGQQTTNFTVTYTNNGPNVAPSVTRTVTIPAGATNIVAFGGTISGNTITYPTLTNVASGATSSFTFRFNAPPVGAVSNITITTVSNTTVTGISEGNNTGANSASVDTEVWASAPFLTTTVTPSANPPLAGSLLTLSVSLTNTGIGTTQATTVTRTLTGLPTGLTGVVFGGPGAATATYDPATGTVSFTGGPYILLAGSNALDYTVSFIVPTPAPAFTVVSTSTGANVTNSNTTATSTTPIAGVVISDVTTTLAGPASTARSQSAAFTVRFTNNGPSTAGSVTRTVTLPAGATSISVPGATLVSGTTYAYPTLTSQASGTTQAFSFSFVAPATGSSMSTTSNTTVTGTGEGNNTAPNSATVLTTLVAPLQPLPVELLAFTVQAQGPADAVLSWRTASEVANDHWNVERSHDGRSFEAIGRLQGQGSKSAPTNYHFVDAGIGTKAKGLVYYRLQQVDRDGSASYSPVQSLRLGKLTATVSLYPSPAASSAQLDLTQLPAGSYQVSLTDLTGRCVLARTLNAGALHALNVQPLAPGTYVLLVRGQQGSVNLSQRLIKE
ncbi:hypothetical protein GCM10023185_03320 [Hymenobacter saemangeumensis]|uniref:T9SS type A sorting domain-containing protein n=1 Tax=Hymenobacter saemangeumensis TaxID=1084522 RepID=A0ABP8HZ62_9BACT